MTTAPFAYADLNELAICALCQMICLADERHCPACTSARLVPLREYRKSIVALIDSNESLDANIEERLRNEEDHNG